MASTEDLAVSEETTLWIESYQGEVLGEAYFTRMAALATDPTERAKITELVRLERCTGEMLRPYLERRGLDIEPDADMVATMSALERYDWTAMLEGIRPVAATYLKKYRQLGQLVGAGDQPAVEALIAHEVALDEFCRRELEGDREGSLDAIHALAHVR